MGAPGSGNKHATPSRQPTRSSGHSRCVFTKGRANMLGVVVIGIRPEPLHSTLNSAVIIIDGFMNLNMCMYVWIRIHLMSTKQMYDNYEHS